MRLIVEKIEEKLDKECKGLVEQSLKNEEIKFSRLKMQESRDLTLTTLTIEQLLSFVLDPTKFLVDDFALLWNDFETSINQTLKRKRAKMTKIFESLKECLTKLNDSISQLKKSSETFKVQEIFQIKQNFSDKDNTSEYERSVSIEIMNIVHLKGLCASDLILNLICSNSLKTNFSPQKMSDAPSESNSFFKGMIFFFIVLLHIMIHFYDGM